MFSVNVKFRIICGFIFILTLIGLSAGCAEKSAVKSADQKPSDKTAENDVLTVSAAGADASEPAAARDAAGSVFVVYVEHGADKSADVYLQKVDAQLKLSGARIRVNPEPGQAKAWRGDPPTIAISRKDEIFVGWTAKVKNSDAASATVLYLSVSRDGGKSFGAPAKVNDDAAPSSHGMHSLAVAASGDVVVAWLDERNVKFPPRAQNFGGDTVVDLNADHDFSGARFIKAHHNSNQSEPGKTGTNSAAKTTPSAEAAEPNSEVYFAVSRDGGATFSANAKLAGEVCPCCKTNLAVAPDGKIYASWRQVLPGDFRHIAVAASADAAKTFGAPVIVSDDKWQISACPVSGAPMIFDAANNLHIFWYSEGAAGSPGLFEAWSGDGGKTFSPRRSISETAAAGSPAVTLGDRKNIEIVWASSDGLYVSELSADSTAPLATTALGAGKLPAAADSVVVFADKTGERQTVRLRAAR